MEDMYWETRRIYSNGKGNGGEQRKEGKSKKKSGKMETGLLSMGRGRGLKGRKENGKIKKN